MADDKVVCTTGIAGLPDPIPVVIDMSEEGCKKAFEELVEYFQNAPPKKYQPDVQLSGRELRRQRRKEQRKNKKP